MVVAHTARVKPVAQRGRDAVFTLPEQIRNVERLIGNPPAVLGPARRHHLVADAAAVEVKVVEAEAGDVNRGRRDLWRRREVVVQEGRPPRRVERQRAVGRPVPRADDFRVAPGLAVGRRLPRRRVGRVAPLAGRFVYAHDAGDGVVAVAASELEGHDVVVGLEVVPQDDQPRPGGAVGRRAFGNLAVQRHRRRAGRVEEQVAQRPGEAFVQRQREADETGTVVGPVDADARPADRRRVERRVVAQTDPPRLPILGVDQADAEKRRFAPRPGAAVGVPDADLPPRSLPRRQVVRRRGEGGQLARHFAAVPEVEVAGVELVAAGGGDELVRLLPGGGAGGAGGAVAPGQARPARGVQRGRVAVAPQRDWHQQAVGRRGRGLGRLTRHILRFLDW